MKTVQDVIKISESEVGYLEKASNSQLEDKTANAGNKNYTKYAHDIDTLYKDYWYNGAKNGFPWCTTWFDWTMIKAYGVEHARKMLYRPIKSLGSSCTRCVEYYKKNNAFYLTPEVGDQIFFYDKKREAGHTGRVIQVTKDTVYTIEGNTSPQDKYETVVANGGAVCKKHYSINSKNIMGYGRPNWSLLKEDKPKETTKKVTDKIDNGKDLSKIQPITKTVKVRVMAKSGLNCRQSANTVAPVLGAFCFGETVELISYANKEWAKVRGKTVSGKTVTGYSARKWLRRL